MQLTTHDTEFNVKFNKCGVNNLQILSGDEDLCKRLWTETIISLVLSGRSVLAVNSMYDFTTMCKVRVADVLSSDSHNVQKGMYVRNFHGDRTGDVTFVTTEELTRFPHWANTGDTLVFWQDDGSVDVSTYVPKTFSQGSKYVFTSVGGQILTGFEICDLQFEPEEVETYVPEQKAQE